MVWGLCGVDRGCPEAAHAAPERAGESAAAEEAGRCEKHTTVHFAPGRSPQRCRIAKLRRDRSCRSRDRQPRTSVFCQLAPALVVRALNPKPQAPSY